VLDGVKADGTHLQRLLHGGVQIVEAEGLEQAQNLDILAASGLGRATGESFRHPLEAWWKHECKSAAQS